MTTLLFDVCMPKTLPDELRPLLSQLGLPEPDMVSLHDLYHQDTLDEVWVPQAVQEGWVVISKDVGKRRRGKGLQLKYVCEKHGVTSVICGPAVGRRKAVDLKITLLSVWRDVCRCFDAPAGSMFLVEPPSGQFADDCGAGRLVLKKTKKQP